MSIYINVVNLHTNLDISFHLILAKVDSRVYDNLQILLYFN